MRGVRQGVVILRKRRRAADLGGIAALNGLTVHGVFVAGLPRWRRRGRDPRSSAFICGFPDWRG